MSVRICPECGQETTEPVCPIHACPTITRSTGSLDLVQAGTVVGGRYRIEKQLGKGGFGAVYLSTHTATRQELVLKILKPDLSEDPTQVQRFFNEARTSSLLSHPNTVRVFDFGQTDAGLLYIAMERLVGGELAQILKAAPNRRIDAARAVRIGIAVCKSLSEAHHAGLVHRDLKPDNIFLCKVHGEDEFVKVIDFGIAKTSNAAADAGLTKTGFAVGTPKYMSPEQVTNKPLDGRSDLYALGIILYQCLAGEVPLAGASPMETLVAHLQQEPVHLRERAPGLPRTLTDLVMRALRKQPWERFADADELRQELEDVLAELEEPRTRGSTGRNHAVRDAHTVAGQAQGRPADQATALHSEVVRASELQSHTPGNSGLPATQPQGHREAPQRAPTPVTGSGAIPAGPLPPFATQSETALLEHPTSRDPYQPQTLTLPTQPVDAGLRQPAPGLAPPAPAGTAHPGRWLWIGAAAVAATVVVAGLWWALSSPAGTPQLPEGAAAAPGPSADRAATPPETPAPAAAAAPASAQTGPGAGQTGPGAGQTGPGAGQTGPGAGPEAKPAAEAPAPAKPVEAPVAAEAPAAVPAPEASAPVAAVPEPAKGAEPASLKAPEVQQVRRRSAIATPARKPARPAQRQPASPDGDKNM